MITETEETVQTRDDAGTRDSEPPTWRLAGWHKLVLWLLGAALLAVVGYRGALGSSPIGAAGAPRATAPQDRMPLAATATAAASGTAASPLAAAAAASPLVASTARAESPDSDAPREAPAPGAASGSPSETATTTIAPSPRERAVAPASSGAAAAPAQAVTPDGKIVLNLATEAELRKLPGIGKSRAHAIVEQRERVGRFRRLEDLLRVKGIGPKRLAVLRAKVVLDAP